MPIESKGHDELVAVTPDELTIVKRTISSNLTFWIADRASKELSFDPPRALTLSSVLAMSPDGLRLVSLAGDGTILQELTRSDRSSEFGTPTDDAFAVLNADASIRGLVFSAAVLAPDDRTLYYTASRNTTDDYPVYVSIRSGSEPWPVGSSIQQCEFRADGSFVPLPTGVSADGRTLFFFDSMRGVARAAFAGTVAGPFSHFTDLGVLLHAQPNATCTRLYYSTVGGQAPIYVAAPE